MRKRSRKIYGVGINDFDGNISVNGKHIYEYNLWKNMLLRCYSENYRIKYPSYADVTVDDAFLSFNNFYNHIIQLKGFKSYDENNIIFHLDKDILAFDKKVYSADTLCFIPSEINLFLTKRDSCRGKTPIGVFEEKNGTFTTRLSNNSKSLYIGSYKTYDEAFNAYKEAKEQQAKVLAERWKDRIDDRVYIALSNYVVYNDYTI